MGFWFYLFLFIWIAYAIFIVRFLKKIIYRNCEFAEIIDPNIKEEYKPFERKDRSTWRPLEIYLMGIFFLPLRSITIVLSVVTFYIVAVILGIKTEEQGLQEHSEKTKKIVCYWVRLVSKIITVSLGIYNIPIEKRKIEEYDPTYPTAKYAQKDHKKVPIIVGGHQTWLDIFINIVLYQPSFLSKKEVGKYPLFGRCTVLIQSIFVDRDSEENRNNVLDAIINRAKQIEQGKNFQPLQIFPEGTTSNGDYLLSFKKGAFEPGYPVKISMLRYKPRHFHPALDSIAILDNYFLLACQWRTEIQVIELDPFYPDHLNIKNYETDWEIYANAVKKVMLKALNIKDSQSGFRHMREYEQGQLKELKKKLRQEKRSRKKSEQNLYSPLQNTEKQ